jgi:hypothetical protein
MVLINLPQVIVVTVIDRFHLLVKLLEKLQEKHLEDQMVQITQHQEKHQDLLVLLQVQQPTNIIKIKLKEKQLQLHKLHYMLLEKEKG